MWQHTIRALALRVLKEILRNQPARFKNYAELTIMKTLEAHKDSHKEVSPSPQSLPTPSCPNQRHTPKSFSLPHYVTPMEHVAPHFMPMELP